MNTGDKCYSACGEIFNYDSPNFDEGDTYFEGTVVQVLASSLVSKWTVDTILEQMDEALYFECGESSEGALGLAEEHKEDLLQLIKNFMDKHASISCYKVEDIVEKIMN